MNAEQFITESNRIEGILRPPSYLEICEYERFMSLSEVTVEELTRFVSVYQPGAVLRGSPGLDVRVGNHYPPRGGVQIALRLTEILRTVTSPYEQHLAYESLHPFTDGNGRSGRMLWMWGMKHAPLGFLHHFYYQTLASTNRR